MIRIILSSMLRPMFEMKAVGVDADGISIMDLLDKVEKLSNSKQIVKQFVKEDGTVGTGTTVYINGRKLIEIDLLGPILRTGDEVRD